MIINFDQAITTFLYNLLPHNQFFNSFFSFFSLSGISIIVWFIAAALLIFFEEKKNRKFIFYLAVSLFITFVLTNVILKNIFQRERPAITTQKVISCPLDFSFPSGHASAAFAGAVILSSFDRKRRLLYFIVATLIAYSRIYLGCHYFIDIVGGGILGGLISTMTLKVKGVFFR